MHYKAHLITKEFPTDEVIDKIMRPFGWEEYNNEKEEDEDKPLPVFTWDWYQVGGRYNSFFELDMEKTEDKYQWDYLKDRVNIVYRSFLFDRMSRMCDDRVRWMLNECDFYPCLGGADNVLRCDGGLIADMKDFDITSCFIIIDADGNAYVRSYWDGKKFIENEKFDDTARDILAASKDYYIVTIDVHD